MTWKILDKNGYDNVGGVYCTMEDRLGEAVANLEVDKKYAGRVSYLLHGEYSRTCS